jgi:LPXTG-motif cell wall-anchored protein
MNTDIAAAPQLLAALPDTSNAWPWIAVAGILLIIAAIAFVARRRSPHGI